MKRTLTFEFDFEDDDLLLQVVHANDLALILWELQHNSRKDFEALAEKATKDELINAFFTRIYDLCDERCINLEALIK